MNTKIFSNKNLIRYLFWYRIALSFIAFYGVRQITNLGDVGQFLGYDPVSLIEKYGFGLIIHKTFLPGFIVGGVRRIVGFDFIANVIFCILGFYGIKMLLDSVPDKENRSYKILILLCFLPSFNLWSSMGSKEAIILFFMGIICREIIRFFNKEKFRINAALIFSLYIMSVMKPQYMPAIIQLIIYIKIKERFTFSVNRELLLISAVIIINISLIYLFRYQLDDYAIKFQDRFRLDAGSARGILFHERFDFFKKMPYLLPLAFWGPSISEAGKSILHVMAFTESLILVFMFIYILKDIIYIRYKKLEGCIHWLFLFINTTALLLFVQYIQGIHNPGASGRYRANLYLLLLTLVYSIIFTNLKKENNEKQN